MKNTRILDVLKQWSDGINAGDYQAVVSMYDEQATLLPTFSNQVYRTPAVIQEYFAVVSENDAVTVDFDQESIQIDPLDSGFNLVTGIYDWNITNSGVSDEVHARFSFVINNNEQAPIFHQHSSVVPE